MDPVLEAIRDLPRTIIDMTGDATLILSNRKYRLLFQCSSKQLIQTCGYFRKKLAPGGQPHLELMRDGKVYLTIHEFDTVVIEQILKLVHGCNESMPEDPSLHMLVEIAKFCDYLDCLPSMRPFSTVWMEKIKARAMGHSTLRPETNSWIFLSYAFRHKDVFRHTTAIAQQSLDGKFDVNKLPIPKEIANRINDAREKYLLTLARVLYARMEDLSSNPTSCATDCNTLYLGLVRKISDTGVFPFNPIPKAGHRFTGYVLRSIFAKLTKICGDDSQRRCPNGKGSHCPNWRCPLGPDVEDHISKFYTLLPGLELPEKS